MRGVIIEIRLTINDCAIVFRPNELLFPQTVAQINAMLHKQDNTIPLKGSIDYDALKPYISKSDVPQEIIDYLFADLVGLPRLYTNYMKETSIIEGRNKSKAKISIGGEVLNAYKLLIPTFDGLFKDHLTDEDYKRIHAGYRGGLVYCNPRHLNQIITKRITYHDLNSSYPAQMKNKPMPYGPPKYITETKNFKRRPNHVYIYDVTLYSAVKQEGQENMMEHL